MKQVKSWQMSLLSAPGNVLIKTTLMKSLPEVLWCTQTVLLSKQELTIVAGRQRDAQGDLVLQAVDLIQRKKLDSRNFYESNLTKARIENNSLPF